MRADFTALVIRILLITVGINMMSIKSIVASETVDYIADDIATLFIATRQVITDHQSLINNPEIGDKGLTGPFVIEKAKRNYELITNRPWVDASRYTLLGEAQNALWVSVEEVMDEAQPMINRQGIGFKAFLPQIFARDVAIKFTEKFGDKITLKQTAPSEYVRNRKYRPDDWEHAVMETKFQSSTWKQGRSYGEFNNIKDKVGYRYIRPEYYGESCLSCHGGPKGRRDRTGGLKRGAELGDLGGAISVIIYDTQSFPQVATKSLNTAYPITPKKTNWNDNNDMDPQYAPTSVFFHSQK